MSEDYLKMLYEWMSLTGPKVLCSQLHCQTSCLREGIKKALETANVSSKLYMFLHLVPFMLFKYKKLKRENKLTEGFKNLIKNYIGSLLFMSLFVSGFKISLCINSSLNRMNDYKFFVANSFLTSLSILFEDKSRRQQIVFFALVRAFRSSYIWCKRRKIVKIPFEEATAFIVVFGFLGYLYHQNPSLLKNFEIFEKIWGIA